MAVAGSAGPIFYNLVVLLEKFFKIRRVVLEQKFLFFFEYSRSYWLAWHFVLRLILMILCCRRIIHALLIVIIQISLVKLMMMLVDCSTVLIFRWYHTSTFFIACFMIISNFTIFLSFHTTILKPYFDLSFGQTKSLRYLDSSSSSQIAIRMEFLFQFQRLITGISLTCTFLSTAVGIRCKLLYW